MKTYIVYSVSGEELGYVKAGSHNAAETKARKKFGLQFGGVAYTEI